MKALLALVKARHLEFIRDRSALAWSLVFPMLVVVVLVVVFDDDDSALFRLGVMTGSSDIAQIQSLKHVELIEYDNIDQAKYNVSRHVIDGLIIEQQYWLNESSAQGYILAQLVFNKAPQLSRHDMSGDSVRHVEWLLPGVIGMNIMFSALYGVGYLVVRYRQTGVLKRISVTPVSPMTFMSSQVLARLVEVIVSSILIFTVIGFLFNAWPQGNFLLIILVTVLGSAAMISIALLVASQTHSFDWCNGILNMLSWPMMLLSGIWFSLEGSKPWVQSLAQLLPLTHMNDANRAVFIDGASLVDIQYPLAVLLVMTLACLSLASYRFKWV